MHVQRLAGVNGAFQALYGTDVRDPTADARIAEFCLSLPEEQFRSGGVSRRLIRRAMADRLPAEILASPRRGIDTADWFERLSGARARVFEALRLLEQSETASAVLDLPRMRRLADQLDQPAGRSGAQIDGLPSRAGTGADGGQVSALVRGQPRLVGPRWRRPVQLSVPFSTMSASSSAVHRPRGRMSRRIGMPEPATRPATLR